MPPYAAATGLKAATKAIEVASHNIANAQTYAYPRMLTVLSDLSYKNERRLGENQNSIGLMQIGSGVAVTGVTSDFTQGNITPAKGDPMNLAIQGEGFFVITRPDGTLGYTRNGQFVRDSTGMVTNSSGYQLGQQPIIIPDAGATDITVKQNGEITAKVGQEVVPLGQIELANFINPSGLKRLGGNLFEATEASGDPLFGIPSEANIGVVRQYMLEESNTNAIDEILSVTTSSHLYNYNLKAFEAATDTEKRLVDSRI